MKKISIVLALLILIPFIGYNQDLEKVDFVSPFNEGFASIKKGNQWAFINSKGDVVIDFRDDMVLEINENGTYPVLRDDMFLIQRKDENITYFGFANKTGKTVISPQYLKATNFKYNRCIALELTRQKLGYNSILDKPVVTYKYREVLIDKTGKVIEYLGPLMPFSIDKYPKVYLEIKSKIISKNLILISDNKQYNLKKI